MADHRNDKSFFLNLLNKTEKKIREYTKKKGKKLPKNGVASQIISKKFNSYSKLKMKILRAIKIITSEENNP